MEGIHKAGHLPPSGTPPQVRGDVKRGFVMALDMVEPLRQENLADSADQYGNILRRIRKEELGIKNEVSKNAPDRSAAARANTVLNKSLFIPEKEMEGRILKGVA